MTADQASRLLSERRDVLRGQLVLPFYLVCDVSRSMSGGLAAVSDGMARLRSAVAIRPDVNDIARLCVISFSDTARVLTPLGRMSEQSVPELVGEGGAVFGAAFRQLARSIAADLAELKGQGCTVRRPCAFFLIGGGPSDSDWHQTFTDTLTYDPRTDQGLTSPPVFVPFGLRDAPEGVLRQLAYPRGQGKWYHAKSAAMAQAPAAVLQIILQTVVAAGRTTFAGQPILTQQPPAPGSGIQQGDSEYDPGYL